MNRLDACPTIHHELIKLWDLLLRGRTAQFVDEMLAGRFCGRNGIRCARIGIRCARTVRER